VSQTELIPSFFLFWGDTWSLRMSALRPASQTGPMRKSLSPFGVIFRGYQMRGHKRISGGPFLASQTLIVAI